MSRKQTANVPLFDEIYDFEININKNAQTHMGFAAQLLGEVNKYLDPQMVMDCWLPLMGIFGHKLMTRMVVSVGLANVVSSIIKWVLPDYRPIWWMKEYSSSHNIQGFNVDTNTCDTSAGFPSSHTITFTAFAFVFIHSLITNLGNKCHLRNNEKYFITLSIISLPLCLLWTSRLYFLTEFLHQCIGAFIIVLVLLYILHHHSSTVLKWKRLTTSFAVLFLGLLTIGVYFVMLQLDIDPHWSVRMAFKWCSDPTLMRHEAGPIFVLFRDFGYMLGIALSCPLLHNYNINEGSVFLRIPVMLIAFFLNSAASQNTPKHMGRWVFLIYELVRSCAQSYTFLSIIPKIVK